MALRAVVDANVLISGLLSPDGAPARVVAAALGVRRNPAPDKLARAGLGPGRGHPLFTMVMCPLLVEETRHALLSPKLSGRVSLRQVERYIRLLETYGLVLPNPTTGSRFSRDPDDDYLVALVYEAGADALVTGDRSLLEAASGVITALSPAEFARQPGGL